MDKWEECQELVQKYFGKRPETPRELVELMIAMAEIALESCPTTNKNIILS